MKAQASLEMVVGLIILLVVAGVVIGLVLHFIKPSSLPNTGEQINKQSFLTNCQSYCDDTTSNGAVNYCKYYWGSEETGTLTPKDWNGNGVKNEMITVGMWVTCEDKIYCFLIQPCDKFGDGGKATLQKCKRLLCQYYESKYGTDENGIAMATRAVHDAVDASQCDFSGLADVDNWYAAGGFENSC